MSIVAERIGSVVRALEDDEKRASLEQAMRDYVSACDGEPYLPYDVTPLSAGLGDSPLISWPEPAAVRRVAITRKENFADLGNSLGWNGTRIGQFNRLLRAFNPASPRNGLLYRAQEGQAGIAPLDAFRHVEDGIVRGLKVDVLPILALGLQEGKFQARGINDTTVRSLGDYCLALFAEREHAA